MSKSADSSSSLAKVPKIETLNRNIRRWRQKQRNNSTSMPTRRFGYNIPLIYQLIDGKKFLSYDSGKKDEERILIFATENGLVQLGWETVHLSVVRLFSCIKCT